MRVRPERLSKEILDDIGVRRDERVLAWARGRENDDRTGSRQFVVATTIALYVPNEAVALGDRATTLTRWTRWSWDRVLGVGWDDGELRLRLQPDAGGQVRERVFMFDDAGEVPAVVWERVEASIVVSQRLTIAGSHGATAVARRRMGTDDISWTVVFDNTDDASRDDLRARAREALSDLRISLGI